MASKILESTELPTKRLWTGVIGTKRTVGKLAPLPQNTVKTGRGVGKAPQGTIEDVAWTPHPRIVEMNGEWPGQNDAGSIRVRILPPLPEGTEEDRKNGIGPQGAPAERFARQTRAPLMNQTTRDTGLKYPQG